MIYLSNIYNIYLSNTHLLTIKYLVINKKYYGYYYKVLLLW